MLIHLVRSAENTGYNVGCMRQEIIFRWSQTKDNPYSQLQMQKLAGKKLLDHVNDDRQSLWLMA